MSSDSDLVHRSGGYDVNIFCKKPPEIYECPLCFEILRDPRQCLNGHCYCFDCISSALNKNKSCPVCKIELVIEILGKNLVTQRQIEDLNVNCISCEKNSTNEHCDWTGPLHARNFHYENICGFYPMVCENGCAGEFLRKDLTEHNKLCDFLKFPCDYCPCQTQQYNRSEIVAHKAQCEYRPVPCVKCAVSVPFSQHRHHIDTECPRAIVECPFIGLDICVNCPGMVERANILNHILEGHNIFTALNKLAEPIVRLKAEDEKYEFDNIAMGNEIKRLNILLGEKDAKLAAVDDELIATKAELALVKQDLEETRQELECLKIHQLASREHDHTDTTVIEPVAVVLPEYLTQFSEKEECFSDSLTGPIGALSLAADDVLEDHKHTAHQVQEQSNDNNKFADQTEGVTAGSSDQKMSKNQKKKAKRLTGVVALSKGTIAPEKLNEW